MNYKNLPADVRAKIQLWADGVTRWDGECLKFLLPLKRGNRPTSGTSVDHVRYNVDVRRFLWVQSGRTLKTSEILRPTCGDCSCVAPAHTRKVTRSQVSSKTARTMTAAKFAQIMRLAQARRKLSAAQEMEVLGWNGSFREICNRLGISRTTYFSIRSGHRSAPIRDPMTAMVAGLRRAA